MTEDKLCLHLMTNYKQIQNILNYDRNVSLKIREIFNV